MSDLFTRYRITLDLTAKIMGGTPRDPKVIEGWIKTKMGLEQGDALRAMVARTMIDLGHDLMEDATEEQIDAAIGSTVAEKSTNGFKRDANGLYVEGRQIKACLKENINIIYGNKRFGPTKKGGKGYLAERVFVEEDEVSLGRNEPDGVEMFIGHVSGPQGPRSTLTYYEYCERPRLTFTLSSLQDCIAPDQWEAIFEQAEFNGVGSLRSQGHGRFRLAGVEEIASPKRPKFFAAVKAGAALIAAD